MTAWIDLIYPITLIYRVSSHVVIRGAGSLSEFILDDQFRSGQSHRKGEQYPQTGGIENQIINTQCDIYIAYVLSV